MCDRGHCEYIHSGKEIPFLFNPGSAEGTQKKYFLVPTFFVALPTLVIYRIYITVEQAFRKYIDLLIYRCSKKWNTALPGSIFGKVELFLNCGFE